MIIEKQPYHSSMKKEINVMPKGLKCLNYAKSTKTKTASDIPIVTPEKLLSAIPQWNAEKDGERILVVESLDFPVSGSGGVYDGSFFDSFISKLKNGVIGGSKDGHGGWTGKSINDLYMIGGMTEYNSDQKSGTAHFLMWIPKQLNSDNYGLINDYFAGQVNFSLVSYPKYKDITNKDTKMIERHFVGSDRGERNDVVDLHNGAMDQVVNSAEAIDFESAKILIENGEFIRKDIDGKIIQNGKVSYSVLRRMVSNADCENKTEIAELISMIDKKKNCGGKTVEKTEVLECVKNMKANGELTLVEVANAMGLQDKIVNEDHVKNAEMVKVLNEKLGTDPITAIDGLLANKKIASELAVINAVTKVAGPEKITNSEGKEVVNPSYTHALEKCMNKEGKDLETAVANLSNDPIMKILQGQRADPNSSFNKNENRQNNNVPAYTGGIRTKTVGGK